MSKLFPKALPLIAATFAAIFAPPEPLVPSTWAAQHLVVAEGPRAGGRWDPALTPYVPVIIDALGPDSPHNLVAVRKSAQTGISVAGIALVSSYIDRAPCRIGYALPTIDLLQEFNRDKLQPTIDQTPALAQRVKPQMSRSSTGSTATSKRFPGGALSLLNANSGPDLRSKTLKLGVADEVDEWEDDLDGQGDPFDLFLGRFIAFHATGDWRVLALSTPRLANESRIDALFVRGDQRFWHVDCPQCREPIVLQFKQLRFERKPPYGAHYVCQLCGGVIEHHEKARLVRAGRFLPTNPQGLYPSFHVDALISQLTTWDQIAKTALDAEGNERKLKAFFNLWLGLTYEVRGDAPDHVRLYERREDYAENVVPPLGLLLVAGCDVQHSGIWSEIVAFAPDRQSWTVTRRFLAGDTTDPNAGAFRALADLYEERFADSFGNRRTIDAMAIDAGDGGRANQVYAFARSRHRAYAVKGMPGWGRPALGTPTKVSITLAGKKMPGGAEVWPVGTWDLKAGFYADLRKDGRKAGAELDPPGYCHFGSFLDEAFFRQMTAESLQDSRLRGRIVKVWRENGPNHLLDCRVYATAMAEHLGLTRKTREQWLALAQRYAVPGAASDLFAPAALAAEREIVPAGAPSPPEVAVDLKRALETKRAAPRQKKARFVRLRRRIT